MLPILILLTDAEGRPLAGADLALLEGHPRLARLVLKAMKTEAIPGLPPRLRALQIEAWGLALLCQRQPRGADLLGAGPPRAHSLKGPRMRFPKFSFPNIDLLGDLIGKARRRQAEAEARHALQAALDASKEALVRLALGTIGAMPEDSAPAALHLIAQTLLTQALASPAVLARVPQGARPAVSAAVMQALAGVPLPDPIRAGAVGTFQINAKTAIAAAIRALTL